MNTSSVRNNEFISMREPIITEEDYHFFSIINEKGLEEEAKVLWLDIHQEIRQLVRPVENDEKSHYRNYTLPARLDALRSHQEWLKKNWNKYSNYFADPQDINPKAIRPKLELVQKQFHRDLFRIARLSWSLPYSRGYGRRLNYLIWDDYNNKIIGILGLQSPPLSLPARDKRYYIPLDKEHRAILINLTMDAYCVGALPPYSHLLGGKLAVLAAASKEVREDYQHRYRERRTIMRDRVLSADLVAITTLSAFGHSSIYNRVSKGTYNISDGKNGKRNLWAAISLGSCQGWGTLHFSNSLYTKMKRFHQQLYPEKPVVNFGTGSKIRFLVTNRILKVLGFEKKLLKHNIQREVYVIPHVENLEEILNGSGAEPIYNDQPFNELAAYWKDRYCLKRWESLNFEENQNSMTGRDSLFQSINLIEELDSVVIEKYSH
ncbi:conserved hypothetical protein [Gloeothece citriformis PCC 7424]|uniref:Uncharacterized protein n=1 Tax=Gloeothece citriformis (strain PCC 7424) TaxID=65393 RepID=B7KDL3_GLOC7|nr:Druantia anti-phage system protein DruA [Gloeothece citriformis]ACK70315.1 conserved hypothetical protein [Gloeothece citriformis PCC 7424]